MEENKKKQLDDENLNKISGGVKKTISDGGDSSGKEWFNRNKSKIMEMFKLKYGINDYYRYYDAIRNDVMKKGYSEEHVKDLLKYGFGFDCYNLV